MSVQAYKLPVYYKLYYDYQFTLGNFIFCVSYLLIMIISVVKENQYFYVLI